MATGAKRHGGKTGGRTKGTPNVLTKELKELILEALNDGPNGGLKWLVKQRDENPNIFGSLLGKVLPLTVQGDKNNPIPFVISTPALMDEAAWEQRHK